MNKFLTPLTMPNIAFSQLSKFTQTYLRRSRTPGAVIGVLHRGRESVAAFGSANLEQGLPVTESTLFQIGSNTKPMVATAAMRLVEQGKLNLDAPIRKVMPNFKMKNRHAAQNVTMRQLLTHVAGWQGDYFNDFGTGDDALEKIVNALATIEQESPLGENYSYNNAAFYVAGRALEIISGMTFEKLIRELVFAPLGMKESFFYPEDELHLHRVAAGHNFIKGKNVVARPWPIPRAAAPAGGVVASAHDMLTFARFQMGNGKVNGRRVLKTSSLREMQEARQPATGAAWLGLSWFTEIVAGMKVIEHGGATNGQTCGYWLIPEKQFALIVLTNSSASVPAEIFNATLKFYFGAKNSLPKLIETPKAELREYVGAYENIEDVFNVSLSAKGLALNIQTKGGFPTPDSPPAPAPPSTDFGFYEKDKFVIHNPAYRARLGEFVRDASGKIKYMRLSRIHTRRS